jgi:phytoene dehydrogenase-like protein
MGKKVALFEKNSFLGGAMAIGLSPLGFLAQNGEKCIAGFGEEFIEKLKERGESFGTRVCPKHNSVTNVDAEAVKLLAIRCAVRPAWKFCFIWRHSGSIARDVGSVP